MPGGADPTVGAAGTCAAADAAFVGPVILPPPSLVVPSPETGTDYLISVASPDPTTHPGPWRTMIVLDADDHFGIALDAYRGWWARGGARPLLLVGVGYGAGFKKPGNRRIRDYTPRVVDEEPESGGAEAFHAFLTETLWPRLCREYPVRSDEPGLAGHSLGGLFALHALFREQPFFRRALAAAPSVWWDDQAMLRSVARFRGKQSRLPARLFLSVGDSDTESMRRDFAAFERQLDEQPFEDLWVRREQFPGRGHFNVVPVAYETGLRTLYG
jgi:uncharacterized protein